MALAIGMSGRSPYGERGLKFDALGVDVVALQSLSLRRAWIEIEAAVREALGDSVALLTESVD